MITFCIINTCLIGPQQSMFLPDFKLKNSFSGTAFHHWVHSNEKKKIGFVS